MSARAPLPEGIRSRWAAKKPLRPSFTHPTRNGRGRREATGVGAVVPLHGKITFCGFSVSPAARTATAASPASMFPCACVVTAPAGPTMIFPPSTRLPVIVAGFLPGA